jgi:hypothetical protein
VGRLALCSCACHGKTVTPEVSRHQADWVDGSVPNKMLVQSLSAERKWKDRGGHNVDSYRTCAGEHDTMIETGAYAERMARYLHLADPPIHAKLGLGNSELAVTRLHAPNGFSDPTDSIPVEKAFSIHLHLRATLGGRLWLGGKLVPTGKRSSGGVTILDLEQDPIAF